MRALYQGARCYGSKGERLGMDLYPYTEDAVVAARQSLLQWRFIDEVAGRLDEAAMQEAPSVNNI